MPRKEYICTGCNERFTEFEELSFDNCCECHVEICIICGSDVKGKKYCPECKPVGMGLDMYEGFVE